MSQNSHDHSDTPGNSLSDLAAAEWKKRLQADPHDIDPELLAAYIEGGLSDQTREKVEEQISESPTALQAAAFLRRALNSTDDEDSERGRNAASTAQIRPPSTVRSRRMRSLIGFTGMAAGLFVTVILFWQAGRIGDLENQNRLMTESGDIQVQQVAMMHKELLANSNRSIGGMPIYAAGSMTPRLISLALLDSNVRARGGAAPSNDEQSLRRSQLQQAESALNNWTPRNEDAELQQKLVESVVMHLYGGEPELAKQRLADTRHQLDSNSPAALNLRTLILLYEAHEGDESKFIEARETLEELTGKWPNYPQGWFNLALLLERRLGRDASGEYWQRYLETESNGELNDVVKRRLSQD